MRTSLSENNKYKILSIFVVGLVLFTTLLVTLKASAQEEANDLEDKIEDRSEKINELEDEISEYETQLDSTRQQEYTLENVVSSLNASVQRLDNDITETEQTISSTKQKISLLDQEIQKAQVALGNQQKSLRDILQAVQTTDSQTLAETFLSAENFAAAWRKADQLQQIQNSLKRRLEETQKTRQNLSRQRQLATEHRQELEELQTTYIDKQAIVANQKNKKKELLSETKEQASKYQSILAEKRQQKEKFERELRSFESQLESSVSDSEVPEQNTGQFGWPVDEITITQEFGGTEFAKRNAGAYGRAFHNGTDFGVHVGTPIYAVAEGKIRATGNTDRFSGCLSYGKWMLVDHNDGLSTLYAHLSRIAGSPGQTVSKGEKIAYSGNSGFSTGPHLHLTTYLKDDVKIIPLGDIKQQTNCAKARIPVAPLDSYLNPMKYLP